MPTYDYSCSACGHAMEVVHGVHGHGPKACPSCGAEGTMHKLIAAPAIHFKGSGWAKKDRSATVTPGKSQAQAASKVEPSSPATPAAGTATGTSSKD